MVTYKVNKLAENYNPCWPSSNNNFLMIKHTSLISNLVCIEHIKNTNFTGETLTKRPRLNSISHTFSHTELLYITEIVLDHTSMDMFLMDVASSPPFDFQFDDIWTEPRPKKSVFIGTRHSSWFPSLLVIEGFPCGSIWRWSSPSSSSTEKTSLKSSMKTTEEWNLKSPHQNY